MYLITAKDDNSNRVMHISNTLYYDKYDNPVIDGDLHIFKTICYVYEVDSIPEYVIPEKYCYTEEKGFYLNPNWEEPDERTSDE